MSRKIIYLIILFLVFAAGVSCSRYNQSAYNGPNRIRAKPHKEWKKPKSRYKRLSDEGNKVLRHDGVEASRLARKVMYTIKPSHLNAVTP